MIVLSVIFVVIYHCVVCHFCRYLPLCCLSYLSLFAIVLSVIFLLFTIVLAVIFVVIYEENDNLHI